MAKTISLLAVIMCLLASTKVTWSVDVAAPSDAPSQRVAAPAPSSSSSSASKTAKSKEATFQPSVSPFYAPPAPPLGPSTNVDSFSPNRATETTSAKWGLSVTVLALFMAVMA